MGVTAPRRLSIALMALAFSLSAVQGFASEATPCPFPRQKEMLVIQLFFGQGISDRGPVSPKEWRSFLQQSVIPRFPDGFTLYDAYGHWMSPRSHVTGFENTKVIVIAAEDTPGLRARIDELSSAYRERFHQESVGIITSSGCGAF